MADTAAAVVDILKTTYATSGYHDLVNSASPRLKELKKISENDGLEFKQLHRTGGNPTYQAMDEGDPLPGGGDSVATILLGTNVGNQTYKQSTINPKQHTQNFRISQRLIALSKGNRGSFVRGVTQEVKGMALDTAKNMEREIFGDGSGTLGEIASFPTGTQIQLSTTINSYGIQDARRFEVGGVYNFWSARTSGATLRTTPQQDNILTAVNTQTGVLTFSATLTGGGIAAGDEIAKKHARTSTARREIMGIDGIVDDADPPMDTGGCQGITVAAAPNWAASQMNNPAGSGTLRQITPRLLSAAFAAVEVTGANTADVILLSYGAELDYEQTQQPVKRSVNAPKLSGDTGGGYEYDTLAGDYMMYGGRPLKPCRFIRANTAYVGDWSTLALYYWSEWEWMEGAVGGILNWLPGTTWHEGVKIAFFELGVTERNAWVRIQDLDGGEPA